MSQGCLDCHWSELRDEALNSEGLDVFWCDNSRGDHYNYPVAALRRVDVHTLDVEIDCKAFLDWRAHV